MNVGFEVYRIRTLISEHGSTVNAGFYVDKRDKLTRKVRWQQLDDDFKYAANELDRSVVAKDQIRTIIQTFRDRLFTEIFPGRTEVPKTLIFAKDDSHADDIVQIVHEEFGYSKLLREQGTRARLFLSRLRTRSNSVVIGTRAGSLRILAASCCGVIVRSAFAGNSIPADAEFGGVAAPCSPTTVSCMGND